MTHKEIEEWVFNPKMPPNGYDVLVRPEKPAMRKPAGFCISAGWPSGQAPAFQAALRGFDPLRPLQIAA